jgi:LacI family transcriptional regulator
MRDAGNSKPKITHHSVGIREIAQALGISIGTVDRALHSRPGINPITRSKVLQMAQTMGYRPNLAARFLKSKKQLRIAAHLPKEIAFFFDAVREGILEAAAPFEPGIQVEFQDYPRLGEGDTELFERALNDGTNGVIISPGAPSAIRQLIRRAARKNIPVVCVATDAPGTERLAAVSACPYTSGAIVGELLCRTLRAPGNLAVVTGSLETEDHADKVRGFRSIVQTLGAGRDIAAIIETHDHPEPAYDQTYSVLRKRQDISGMYVGTANSLPVLRAIEDAGQAGKISVVTTDLFPALVPLIRSGRVLATINQRPLTQGRLALQALYQFLVAGKCPRPNITIAPHIVMLSNLDLFARQLAPASAEREESSVR